MSDPDEQLQQLQEKIVRAEQQLERYSQNLFEANELLAALAVEKEEGPEENRREARLRHKAQAALVNEAEEDFELAEKQVSVWKRLRGAVVRKMEVQGKEPKEKEEDDGGSGEPKEERPEITIRRDRRLKIEDLPKLLIESSETAWPVVTFLDKFRTKMKSNHVSDADQKDYLVQVVPHAIAYVLEKEGLKDHTFEDLVAVLKRRVLGSRWETITNNEWDRLRQKSGEKVQDFQFRCEVYARELDMDLHSEASALQFVSAVRGKLLSLLVEMTEEAEGSLKKMRPDDMWVALEKMENLRAFKREVEERKFRHELNQRGRAQDTRANKDTKDNKDRNFSKDNYRGKVTCFRCGSTRHYSDKCDHPKGKLIQKGADGRWPKTCHRCFKEGHGYKECPEKPKEGEGTGKKVNLVMPVGVKDLCWIQSSPLSLMTVSSSSVRAGDEPLNDFEYLSQEEIVDFFMNDGVSRFSNPDLLEKVMKDVNMVKKRKKKKSSTLPLTDVSDSSVSESSGSSSSSAVVEESACAESESGLEEKNSTSYLDQLLKDSNVEEKERIFSMSKDLDVEHTPFLLNMGGLNLVLMFDTGAPYLIVKKELYDQMPGQLVEAPIAFRGLGEEDVNCKFGKKVLLKVPNFETSWLAYPYSGSWGIEGVVPRRLGERLGVRISGLPSYFVDKIVKKVDEEWVKGEDEGRDVFKESLLPEKDRQLILDGIKKAMEENGKLPINTQCNLPNSKFRIELIEGTHPVYWTQYTIPEAVMPQVLERAGEWLENQWVVLYPPEERNNWNSPLLAVKKISGGFVFADIRLCMDFRGVNKVTKAPNYVLPLLKEMLGRLTGLKIFSELDLVSAFHQIGLEESSREFTGFTIPGKGQAMWLVMFFGPKGAVTHFQKVMERVVGDISFSIVIVIYVDNLLLGSKTIEQHIYELNVLIHALTKAGMKLKPSKCKIGYSAIQFMGAIVDGEKRGVDPHKAKVFQEMARPKTGKEVQQVLGFVNFLRDFIPLYACVVGPLEKLRSVKVIDDALWFSSAASEAFDLAKKILSEAPVLMSPDWDLEFVMETDASQYGVGGVLLQHEKGGGVRYIDFCAKAFNSSQANYSAVKRELLAGLYAMEKWRPFLLYRKFIWGMDNKALTFLNQSKSRVILDWVNLFQDYDFETRFKRGVLNVLPHTLSHMYGLLDLDWGSKNDEGVQQGEPPVRLVNLAAVSRGVGSKFRHQEKKFVEEKLHKKAPSLGERLKRVLDLHKENHVGGQMMYQMLWEDDLWWESMWKDCMDIAKSCEECIRFNAGKFGFQPMSTICADRPWDHMLMDLIGLLLASEAGYTFILILVDVLTRFVILRPLKTKSAVEIAHVLVEVFANFGVPKILQTDNEQSFISDVLVELRKLSGFQHRRIMKYYPRQNGVVEVYVRETKNLLKKWAKGDMQDWEHFVPAIQMSLNDRIISRHGSRPFSLLFGRRMNGFEDFRETELSTKSPEELLANAEKWGETVWSAISAKSAKVGQANVDRSNKKGGGKYKRESLNVGDMVVKAIQKKRGKMGERWEGPFVVKEFNDKLGGYKIQTMDGKLLKDYFPIRFLKLVEKAIEESDEPEYDVEKILSHRGNSGNREYKIQWEGYKRATWEPERNIIASDCVKDYWARVNKEKAAQKKAAKKKAAQKKK